MIVQLPSLQEKKIYLSKNSAACIVAASLELLLSVAIVACSPSGGEPQTNTGAGEAAESAEAAPVFPDQLAAFGNGYPEDGDPCKQSTGGLNPGGWCWG